VCEQFGVESRPERVAEQLPYLQEKTETRVCDDVDELRHLLGFIASAEYPQPAGERVAIVGSGPAGLAAAHDLALMGDRRD
jgi:NADPH-dependent glutamate synthase beta subunit-like oxidoreductase